MRPSRLGARERERMEKQVFSCTVYDITYRIDPDVSEASPVVLEFLCYLAVHYIALQHMETTGFTIQMEGLRLDTPQRLAPLLPYNFPR